MLNLHIRTSKRWLDQVDRHLDEILLDHAICEMKAAATAMNLMLAYVRLAGHFVAAPAVQARLAELAAAEAEIIRHGDPLPRVHS